MVSNFRERILCHSSFLLTQAYQGAMPGNGGLSKSTCSCNKKLGFKYDVRSLDTFVQATVSISNSLHGSRQFGSSIAVYNHILKWTFNDDYDDNDDRGTNFVRHASKQSRAGDLLKRLGHYCLCFQPPQSTGPVSEQPQLQVIKMHTGKRGVVNRLYEAALFPKRSHSKLMNLTHIFQEWNPDLCAIQPPSYPWSSSLVLAERRANSGNQALQDLVGG